MAERKSSPVTHVEVDGRRLRLSNLEKVLYPATGFTKGQVVDYYARIGPTMLPHLARRPVTMVRLPDGIEGERFFEKRCPGHRPDWLPTVPLDADSAIQACCIEEVPSLVWTANLAALELHTPQATADEPWKPTAMVFDLDPGAPADVVDCARVARELADLLEQLGLHSVVKTSGSKGLHLSVPLRPVVDAETTKSFALALGQLLEQRDPKRVTVTMAKEQRPNKVFVDWSQNDRHKTTVCAYSLRATPTPGVSTPLSWDEVDEIADGDAELAQHTPTEVVDRVHELGDLYADSLAVDQELPALG
ncbi:MAG TPA: non-homologous end-joining DNA ligase [Acidimicrobiia bacterium]|nr:non-homologous end-joining DNA ligase [Acidimicrobiia bacterium]